VKKKSDCDVINVLEEDGLPPDSLTRFRKYENVSTINVSSLREELGMGSWAVRIAYNELFGGVIIQQQPGEGNRKHYHPDADENWVILEGEWEWWIEGIGNKVVKENEIIVVPKNTWHKITCIGTKPGIRYAITRPDVNHVYED
jgi:mannose-6-phosphate isomerase-like protein (cupin superfamily)